MTTGQHDRTPAKLGLLDEFRFGRYRGQLVGTIIEQYPGYVQWLLDKTDHTLSQAALDYFEEIMGGSGE